MEIAEAIERRRSVKRFDPDHVMPEETIRELMRLTLLSPTAFNIQNWRFVLVRDGALRRELRAVSWDQAQVTDASLVVAVCADLLAWEKQPERYWRDAPAPVREFLVPAILNHYRGKGELQRDEAMRSGGLAAQTLMLAAQGLGYDTCPMTGCDFPAVERLLDLPYGHILVMMVAVGKPLQPAMGRGGQLPMAEVVFTDRFPSE